MSRRCLGSSLWVLLTNLMVGFSSLASGQSLQSSAPQPWSAAVGYSFAHGFKENSKDSTVTDFSGAYSFGDLRDSHSASLDFQHIYTWNQFEDKKPSQLRSLDLSYGYQRQSWAQAKTLYTAILGLPVSDRDQQSGFTASMTGLFGVLWTPSKERLTLEGGLTAYSFKYDTADEAGQIYNKKYSFLTQARWEHLFSKRWKTTVLLRGYDNTNLAGTHTQDYLVSAGAAYRWTKNLSTDLKWITTDNIETYKSPFSEDVTYLQLGLAWSI